jgi:uncharacterized membrane protein YheB (UPF0754 family)
MNIIVAFSGPVIGAIIGYGTNYIAVKMLFRPLYPVKIGKYVLPFTPGIIPKEKDRIAKALGGAVGGILFTKEDIEHMLLSEETKKLVTGSIIRSIYEPEYTDVTLEQTICKYIDHEDYISMKTKLISFLCDKIEAGIEKLDIVSLLIDAGGKAIKEKTLGTMLAMFLNDKVMSAIAEPIGEKVNQYINGDGKEKIATIITDELNGLEQKSVAELLSSITVNEDKMQRVIENIYMDFARNKAVLLVSKIDIASIVEKKVSAMDVMELEQLVLSVMKKELHGIVNIGALIGFIIGLLTLLF